MFANTSEIYLEADIILSKKLLRQLPWELICCRVRLSLIHTRSMLLEIHTIMVKLERGENECLTIAKEICIRSKS